MDWRLLEVWQIFQFNWITFVGCLGILIPFLVAIWSIKIDDNQVNRISYNPKDKSCHISGGRGSSNCFTDNSRNKKCTNNSPEYPNTLIIKTPSIHAPSLPQEKNENNQKRT